MSFWLHILEHTLIDALKMLPFLLIAYLLMEYLEHKASEKMQHILQSGRLGPVAGAALGCVPQCGFSVMASNLYAGRLISVGTLLAVYIATSDEAIPLLLTHPNRWSSVLPLILIKLLIAIPIGLLADTAGRRLFPRNREDGEENLQHLCAHCGCEHGIIKPALKHTVQTLCYIFLFTLLMNLAVEWIGEECLAAILMHHSLFQPVLAAVIGFIPNCASSVLLTELYLAGSISFGSAIAGLCTGAGVGLAVLFRMNRHWKENMKIVAVLFAAGSIAGIFLQILGI